jgi:hypothetical protein
LWAAAAEVIRHVDDDRHQVDHRNVRDVTARLDRCEPTRH